MTVPPPPEGALSLEKSGCHSKPAFSMMRRAITGIPLTIGIPIVLATSEKKMLGIEDPTVVSTGGRPSKSVISLIIWFFVGSDRVI